MSKLLHSTLFFLDLRVRDVFFFLCKYLLTRKSKSISYVLRIILSIIPWKVSSSSRMCQDDLQVAQVEKRFRWFEWCANILAAVNMPTTGKSTLRAALHCTECDIMLFFLKWFLLSKVSLLHGMVHPCEAQWFVDHHDHGWISHWPLPILGSLSNLNS